MAMKRTYQPSKLIRARLTTRLVGVSAVRDIRGMGLMIGIEMVEDKASRAPLSGEKMGAILGRAFQGGVILVPCGRNGNVIRIMPSLTVSRAYLFKALDILLEAIKAA